MTHAMNRVILAGAVVCLTAAPLVAQPTTVSKSSAKGAPTSTTQTLSGTVVRVDGGTVAVRMASGGIRMFTPPADRRFMVDGKSLRVDELQEGTRLNATVTETSTPVTDRTVESLEGRVWYAAGPTVILTLPSGQNRMYTIAADSPVKFTDDSGKSITVFDLRKDMNIKAVRITEAPRVELVTNAVVTGSAPARTATGATGATGASAPAASRATTEPAAAPAAPRAAADTSASAAASTRRLPKTASQLPLLGATGLVSLLAGLGLTLRRHRASR